MKLIGVMSLQDDREVVRGLLRDRGVSIYSETEIVGHSTESIARIGWFTRPNEWPDYAALSFAIVPDEAADGVFEAIAARQASHPGDHPIRAFVVPVERMV
ncbi:MAG: hypothetical protein R3D98_09885 [Candidatus Krumholzibacteriia bacterium]